MTTFAGLLAGIWEWVEENAIPWVIVDDGSSGVLYFLGNARWVLNPREGLFGTNLFLYLPLACYATIVETEEQILVWSSNRLLSEDAKTLTGECILGYQINDPIASLTKTEDVRSSLLMYMQNAISNQIRKTDSGRLNDSLEVKELTSRIKNHMREDAQRIGVTILSLSVMAAPSRNINLIQEGNT